MVAYRMTTQKRFFKKLAQKISNDEYSIDTWPSNFYSSIREAINMLPEDIRKVMVHRFNGETQYGTGRLLGLTTSRIQQIEKCGIFELKRTDIRRACNLREIALYGKVEAEKMAIEVRKSVSNATSLWDLGLSVRPYNVLYRAKAYTLGDVVDAVTSGRAKSFIGMGKKAYKEVVDTLKGVGFLDSNFSDDI